MRKRDPREFFQKQKWKYKMSNSETNRISEVEAKGGRRVKGMPYVLGISLFAIIILIMIVYAFFASWTLATQKKRAAPARRLV